MIELLEFRIEVEPLNIDAKYLVSARFIDTDSPESYDKMFSMIGNNLKRLLAVSSYQITCVLCAEDPRDTDTLNRLFGGYRVS